MPHLSMGCDVETCQESACDVDPLCCESRWDHACVELALERCGICPADRCRGDASRLLYPFVNDGTWTQSMNRNDDGSSAQIPLPFTFSLYGTNHTSCYINNNGNLTFGQASAIYTPEGFPTGPPPRVAAFWTDVDTRPAESGLVWHKLVDANTLVVTWDNVGYYNRGTNRLNTFQLVISNGGNALMGSGNNVCFSYENMCWATTGGFGSSATTVGANRGNSMDFFQIGRFGLNNNNYDGPFGADDGVDYLDRRLFCVNAGTLNIPPIASDFPAGNRVIVDLAAAGMLDLMVRFLSPEADQTTTVSVEDRHGAVGRGLQIESMPGNTANVSLRWSPQCCDQGTYELEFTATDSFVGAVGETRTALTIEVVCPNRRPICRAGGPYELACTGAETIVALDGSASADGDDPPQPLTYRWSTNCREAPLSDPQSATPTLTIDSGRDCDVQCTATLEVSDGICNETCVAAVRVSDQAPPSISVPADIEINAPDGACQAAIDLGPAVATDECTPSPPVTTIRSDGRVLTAPFASGTTTINYTARDRCGRAATETQQVTVHPSPNLADIVIEDLIVPAEGLTEQAFQVSWTVRNIGMFRAMGTWQDHVFLLLDGGGGKGKERFLGPLDSPRPLERGESYTRVAAQFRLPSQPGEYGIRVVIDANDELCELNEDNNTLSTVTPILVRLTPKPDLRVIEIMSPASGVLSGTTPQIRFVVKNEGTGATETPTWSDAIFLGTSDSQIGTHLRSANNPQFLLPGGSYEQLVDIDLPHDVTGTYYLAVRTDSGGRVGELNETNNLLFSGPFFIELESQPDLVVDNVGYTPNPVFSAQNFTATWAVRNIGAGPTDGGSWTDRVYLSSNDDDSIGGDDFLLGEAHRGGGVLQMGQSDTARSLTRRLPPELEGRFYVKVQGDSRDQISEFGFEGNNVAVSATQVEVILSVSVDLLPTDIHGPASAVPGHTFSFSFAAENNCGKPQFLMEWEDRVYLSTDQTLDRTRDILLGTFPQSTTAEEALTIAPYEKTRSARLPNQTAAAPHWLIVELDGRDDVFEAGGCPDGEGNNIRVSAMPIRVEQRPTDLTIEVNFDPLSPLPDSAAAGQEIKLTWRVMNTGLFVTPVSTWRDRVVLSADGVWSGDDRVLTTVPHSPELQPGASYTTERRVDLPLVGPGDYQLLFVTDADNSVFEPAPGESNNVDSSPFSITEAAPDLRITQTQSPDSAESGQPVRFSWTVTNGGTLPTHSSVWTDRVWLSQNRTLTGDYFELGSRTHSGILDVGGSYTAGGDLVIPITRSGMYHVIMTTDASHEVFESSEKNNTIIKDMLVDVELSPPANLMVAAVNAADMAVSGQSFNVTWTVQNSGGGPTNVAAWNDSVYLSRDQFIDADVDIHLGTQPRIGVLAAGLKYTVSREFPLPFGPNGPYFVIVRTDANGQVFEQGRDDDNDGLDSGLTEISVPPPSDLEVGPNVIPPDSGILGEPATFRWQVTNSGGNPVNGGWQDSVYLSADPTWDINDRRMGTFARPAGPLNPTEFAEVSGRAPIPAVLPGTYHVIVRTDVFNQIPETDETNNLGGSAGTIMVSAIPLTLGIPFTGELPTGEEKYFELEVPEGETVRITLDHASPSAWTELYVKLGSVPSTGDFDFLFDAPAQPDQETVVPRSLGGKYFILARATAGAHGKFPSSVSLLTEVVPFSITRVMPKRVGNYGRATLRVQGARFDQFTNVTLLRDGFAIQPIWIEIEDSTLIDVTFDLMGAEAGTYDLQVRSAVTEHDVDLNTGTPVFVEEVFGEYTLPSSVEVVNGGGPAMRLEIVTPSAVLLGRTFPVTLEVANQGLNDASVPIVLLASPNGSPISLTSSSGGPRGFQEQVVIIGSLRGPVLAPGEAVAVSLSATATRTPFARFVLQDLTAIGEIVNWSLLESYYRDGSSDMEWASTWENFLGIVGPTWDTLHDAMRKAADDRSFGRWIRVLSGEVLIRDLLERARAGQSDSMGFRSREAGRFYGSQFTDAFASPARNTCCDPYTSTAEALLAEAWCDASIPALTAFFGPEVGILWAKYLLNSPPTRPVHSFTGFFSRVNLEFRIDPGTIGEQLAVAKEVEDKLQDYLHMECQDLPENVPMTIPLATLFTNTAVGEACSPYRNINYSNPFNIPGNIAGGTDFRKQVPPDERFVSGEIILTRHTDKCGDTTSVDGRLELMFRISDTIDFCPGQLGASYERLLTVPMCRLEASGRAFDIGIQVEFDGQPVTLNVPVDLDDCDPPCPPQPPGSDCPTPCPEECNDGNNSDGRDCDGDEDDVPVVVARDPNEKVGPAGFGTEHWIGMGGVLPYRVFFENVPDATAPASGVTITDALDPALNIGSFRVGDIIISGVTFDVPDNRISYQARLDLRTTRGVYVDLTAGVNAATREAFWILQSIDPETGEPPLDPQKGFLPPNVVSPLGEGAVDYTIRPSGAAATGSVIRNRATIVFDVNEPIITNEVFNSLDIDPPASRVSPLPAISTEADLQVSWTGEDPGDGSGVSRYTIYARRDGEAFAPFIGPTDQTSGLLETARGGTVYEFYSVARDNAGNEESAPPAPDAVTAVALQSPLAPSLGDATATTLRIAGLGLANADAVEHAVFEAASNSWIGPTGQLQAEPFWRPLVNWQNIQVRALLPATSYTFRSQARSEIAGKTELGEPASAMTSIAGDVDGDGLVLEADLQIVQTALGTRFGDPGFDARADLNGDDRVTFVDVAFVRANLRRGDFGMDGRVKLDDFADFQNCFTGPDAADLPTGCAPGDLDWDEDIDLDDFSVIELD